MKLRTVMRIDGLYTAPIGDDADMSHDASAAHALMMAQDEFWKQDDLDSLDARDAVEMIGVRADELMREWGFNSEPTDRRTPEVE